MSSPKRLLLALTVFCFLVSACTPAKTTPPVTPVAATSATQTLTPIPTLTATQPPMEFISTPTISPTETLALSVIEGITPLPTIPTFTPTFDVRTIVTATPAPAAECPKENPDTSPANILPEDRDPYLDKDFIDRVIHFLNAGGSTTSLIAEVNKPDKWGHAYATLNQVDITNDGIPELLIAKNYSYYVLMCDQQNYGTIYIEETFTVTRTALVDLNQNAIPELTVTTDFCADRNCIETWILEWDGTQLKTLLHSTDDSIFTADLNNDGIQEVIGIEYPNYPYNEPTDRDITTIYSWNGLEFAGKPFFSDAKYRFQAIQDADNAAMQGEYTKAFKLYESAISSKLLKPWSLALDKYYEAFSREETPFPTPLPDLTEYPKLAAYAYYRMVILHTRLGQMDAAATQYATLQKKFPGQPYAEMASAFWGAYQSSHNMTNACGAAIAYAAAHPDMLTVLGRDYHGSQSHIYVPADVCPFR